LEEEEEEVKGVGKQRLPSGVGNKVPTISYYYFLPLPFPTTTTTH